jgi:hypothetical protein
MKNEIMNQENEIMIQIEELEPKVAPDAQSSSAFLD